MPSIPLTTNVASLNAQRRVGESTAKLRHSFERLSSGLRINKAGDDAAGLSIAAGLNADARVFTQGVRNLNDGISHLDIAEGATGQLKDILVRIRELATQSSNGTLSNTQHTPLNDEVQGLVTEYNRIIEVTAFNGRRVFDAANATLSIQAGNGEQGAINVELGFSITRVTGDGTFQPRQAFAAGASPGSVAAADFDGDGVLDLAVSNGAFSLSVLLGNGDGTFQSPQAFTTGINPNSIVAGDFDGDGVTDLVTADQGGSTLSVLLGNGDGTFQPRQAFTAGTFPSSVAVADFDGDGATDLATTNVIGNTVSVLLANAVTTTTTLSIRPLSGLNVATRTNALSTQDAVDAYLTEVNAVAGLIGSASSRLQTAASVVRVSSENFIAAESRIVDADVAEDSATLARGRILQQAGAAVLSSSNQQPSLVLELLREP